MKKVILSSMAVVALLIATFNTSHATKWVDGPPEVYGECVIQHQSCQRRFLSFDGCRRGETRAIFDLGNSDCQKLVANGALAF